MCMDKSISFSHLVHVDYVHYQSHSLSFLCLNAWCGYFHPWSLWICIHVVSFMHEYTLAWHPFPLCSTCQRIMNTCSLKSLSLCLTIWVCNLSHTMLSDVRDPGVLVYPYAWHWTLAHSHTPLFAPNMFNSGKMLLGFHFSLFLCIFENYTPIAIILWIHESILWMCVVLIKIMYKLLHPFIDHLMFDDETYISLIFCVKPCMYLLYPWHIVEYGMLPPLLSEIMALGLEYWCWIFYVDAGNKLYYQIVLP